MKTLAILLLILPNLAFGHGDDHKVTQVTTKVTNIYNSTSSQGVASAIAQSQLHFDGSNHRLQIAVGIGNYEGNSALSLGMAQKLGSSGPLISGSVSRDSLHTGVGVGCTFRF